jgi:hypothetical protein
MADDDNKESKHFTMLFKKTEKNNDPQNYKQIINISEVRFGTHISKSRTSPPSASTFVEATWNNFNQYNSPGESYIAFDSPSNDRRSLSVSMHL